MSRKSIQAFSAGIISATAILSITYFLTPDEKAESADLTEKQVNTYLASEGKVSIQRKDYESLIKTKEAFSTQKKPQNPTPSKDQNKTPEQEFYRIFIHDGMSIDAIADQLEEGQVIQSSEDFSKYLIDAGLHTKIRQGNFKLPTGRTNEEAAKLLVK
ncbi:hypothetical protein GKZ89_03320 [Bacillus mangrovi]|uniref:Aminodeoxychorismate lyase n=1 Tax=Metabacillus mangrovi TaxID=1491830 RepID=A0A7X2V3T8_9BACI|nr:hypothetical protein [Metabacillus mangrovi]MTH52424.1 hypothetical protein [Metabacillus mangrovi]